MEAVTEKFLAGEELVTGEPVTAGPLGEQSQNTKLIMICKSSYMIEKENIYKCIAPAYNIIS